MSQIIRMTLFAALILPFAAAPLLAHCDTLDGPVVSDARLALADGDLTPALKWVRAEDEKEIREAFTLALETRGKGEKARELADRYFFETVVRVHRAGEGAPYTGLKPAGQPIDDGIEQADRAIESGSIERAAEAMQRAVSRGMEERFHRVIEAKKHAGESVEKGRAYVAAYVDFIHYVERLHEAATRAAHPAHAH